MTMTEKTKLQFEQEKQAYWRQREALLKEFAGKWVAIVDGRVAGVADQMNKAAAEAVRNVGRRVMYVNLVGNEDVVLRIRQVSTGYSDRWTRRHQRVLFDGLFEARLGTIRVG